MTECVLCMDVITNPLCPHCLVEEMVDWAQGQEEVLRSIKEELKAIKCFDGTSSCIKCTTNFSVCAYCFTEQVKENLDYYMPEIAEEFARFFNFREVM